MKMILIILAALLFSAPQSAHAYVDPGVGGMFYQIVILLGAAVATGFAVFRNKLKSMFGGKKDDEPKDDQSN